MLDDVRLNSVAHTGEGSLSLPAEVKRLEGLAKEGLKQVRREEDLTAAAKEEIVVSAAVHPSPLPREWSEE